MKIGKTPEFVKIKTKKSKRLSPYLESEIWEKDELLSIIKYEQHKRNKAALTLFWDLNGRNHEITMLKLKHIRIKQNYAEGEVTHEANAGSGPILLTNQVANLNSLRSMQVDLNSV
jgi:D-lyxose ketol-isomerase